ncbi:MAG: hypothetical protein PHH32_02145 [Eubacteriales bacterium]|nr:hypothetical protein [Eubacteriales bacterium]
MDNNLQYKLGSTYSRILDACDSLQGRIDTLQDELATAGIRLDHTGISGPIGKLLAGMEDLRKHDFAIQTQGGE